MTDPKMPSLDELRVLDAAIDALDPTPETPSATRRGSLLDALSLEGRFARFAEAAAEILDLPKDRAVDLLDQIDSPDVFVPELPGVEFFWLPGGPRCQDAVRGFLRIDRRAVLPEHEHLGEEHGLVLQGIYVDGRTGERMGPGSHIHGATGTTHEFRIDQEGTDLLMLIVVQKGYRIGELLIEPRD